MDVNSGAIVAMASYPNYDLNDYGTIFDDALKTKLDTELAKIDAKRSTYESEEAYARPGLRPSTALFSPSGATSASTPPTSRVPPISPLRWRRRWRRAR